MLSRTLPLPKFRVRTALSSTEIAASSPGQHAWFAPVWEKMGAIGTSGGDGREPETVCVAGRGAAAFVTPCLLLAATVAAGLSQLGVTVADGLAFTVVIFLLLDFLAYRYGVLLGDLC